MGSGESTTRKVSFGVDDEDRVRILRGVKLSEDVLQRMRGVANIAPEQTPTTSAGSQKDTDASSSSSSDSQKKPQQQTQPGPQSKKQEDEKKRFEQQQTILKDELSKMAQKEAVVDELTKARSKERLHARKEAERAKQMLFPFCLSPFHSQPITLFLPTLETALSVQCKRQIAAGEFAGVGDRSSAGLEAQKLQKKDSQLKALEAFYKSQIAQLEKRNREEYEQSKDQFHQAASKTEENVRARSTQPVCPGLQAQILSCYKDNGDQTLRCSDLAKEYMKCIQAAKKNLLVNHG